MKSKKIIISSLLFLSVTAFVKCGPAGEDREKMHIKAQRVSDSIARVVDSAMIIRP